MTGLLRKGVNFREPAGLPGCELHTAINPRAEKQSAVPTWARQAVGKSGMRDKQRRGACAGFQRLLPHRYATGFQASEDNKHCQQQKGKLSRTIAPGVFRLKSVPEEKGTMFDNTMIFYFPNRGETHHSQGTEFPFIVLSGSNCKLKLGSRYVPLPYWGTPGHKTLGNFYTTILNAHGNPIKHYGDPDLSLKFEQTGPINQFMARAMGAHFCSAWLDGWASPRFPACTACRCSLIVCCVLLELW
jgi:hypothetical protein